MIPKNYWKEVRKLLDTPEGKEILQKIKSTFGDAPSPPPKPKPKPAPKGKGGPPDVEKPKGPKPTKSPTGKDRRQRQAEALARAIKNDEDTRIRRKFEKNRMDMELNRLENIETVKAAAAAGKKQDDASTVVSTGLSRQERKAQNRAESLAKADKFGYESGATRRRDRETLRAAGITPPPSTVRRRKKSQPKWSKAIDKANKPQGIDVGRSPSARSKAGKALPKPKPAPKPKPKPKSTPKPRSKEWSEGGRRPL